MRDIRICAVVMSSSMDELLSMISQAETECDLVEVRIDYLLQPNEKDLHRIKENIKKEVIITCRRMDEGGKWAASEASRVSCLQTAYDLGFNYVDMELKTLDEKKFKIPHKSQTKTIISYHDFKQTPSHHELKGIILKMKQYNPYLIKIATMINHENDTYLLYKLLVEKKKEDKYIIIGMGNKGVSSRVISPLLGGHMTYCNFDKNGSAPGQISCKKMKKIYSLIS